MERSRKISYAEEFQIIYVDIRYSTLKKREYDLFFKWGLHIVTYFQMVSYGKGEKE